MARMPKSERIQLWLDRLKRYSQSRLTVIAFCQQEEISVPSFYQWKRRLAPSIDSTSSIRPKVVTSDHVGFTELVVQPSDRSTGNPTGNPTGNLCVPPNGAYGAGSIPSGTNNDTSPSAFASLPGGITISLGAQPEIASLIVDRLLRHTAGENSGPCKDTSC